MAATEQKAVIDRIEDGAWAVLLVGEAEDEKVIPASQLPAGAGEGTWLRVRLDGDAVREIVVDAEATQNAQARIRPKMDALRQRKPQHRPLTADDEAKG